MVFDFLPRTDFFASTLTLAFAIVLIFSVLPLLEIFSLLIVFFADVVLDGFFDEVDEFVGLFCEPDEEDFTTVTL